MLKIILVNLILGALVGLSHYLVLTIVLALPILPAKLYVSCLWLAAILESTISLALTCLVLGGFLSRVLKRFVRLLPLAAAFGFLVGTLIYLAPLEWLEIETSIGTKILILRIGELVAGSSLLAAVWWYSDRQET